jgi:hypothetical protein
MLCSCPEYGIEDFAMKETDLVSHGKILTAGYISGIPWPKFVP